MLYVGLGTTRSRTHLNPTYELSFFVGWVEGSETQQETQKVECSFFVGWVEGSETQQETQPGICWVSYMLGLVRSRLRSHLNPTYELRFF